MTLRKVVAALVATAVALLVLTGCETSGGTGSADADELALWVLPAQVAGFARAERVLDPGVPELIGHYQSSDPRVAVVGSIFVYPATASVSIGGSDSAIADVRQAATQQEFAATMLAVESAHPGAELLHEGEATIQISGADRSGFAASYAFREPFFGSETDLTSQLFIFRFGDWIVKYRFTYPASREVVARARVEAFVSDLAWPSIAAP